MSNNIKTNNIDSIKHIFYNTDKPIIIHILLGLIFTIVPLSQQIYYLFNTVILLLIALMIFNIGKLYFSNKKSFLLTVVFLLYPLFWGFTRTLFIENIHIFIMSLLVYVILKYEKSKSIRQIYYSMIIIFIGILVKQTFLLYTLFIIPYLIKESFTKLKRNQKIILIISFLVISSIYILTSKETIGYYLFTNTSNYLLKLTRINNFLLQKILFILFIVFNPLSLIIIIRNIKIANTKLLLLLGSIIIFILLNHFTIRYVLVYFVIIYALTIQIISKKKLIFEKQIFIIMSIYFIGLLIFLTLQVGIDNQIINNHIGRYIPSYTNYEEVKLNIENIIEHDGKIIIAPMNKYIIDLDDFLERKKYDVDNTLFIIQEASSKAYKKNYTIEEIVLDNEYIIFLKNYKDTWGIINNNIKEYIKNNISDKYELIYSSQIIEKYKYINPSMNNYTIELYKKMQ